VEQSCSLRGVKETERREGAGGARYIFPGHAPSNLFPPPWPQMPVSCQQSLQHTSFGGHFRFKPQPVVDDVRTEFVSGEVCFSPQLTLKYKR
jgi:hypothetical protein